MVINSAVVMSFTKAKMREFGQFSYRVLQPL